MRLLSLLQEARPYLDLHLPAHGRGRGLAPGISNLLRRRPGGWDLPELPQLGGPLEPSGAVAEDQAASARLCGAARCWFGVNGATGMLQTALLALARPGERVLLPRNLHRSLLHGCVLGGLRPVLFDLPFEPSSGLWLPPTPEWLEARLAQAPPLAALVLVNPTYQGLAGDLEALIACAHRRGLPVLVDEAHGAHFGQPGLPQAALAAGADLVVQSLHKSAGGLAQSAALLLGASAAAGGRVSAAAVDRALLWLQTSSPSALLLASAAAALAHRHSPAGTRALARALARAQRLRGSLAAAGLPLVANHDPLRLVLHTARMGINGLTADAWLIERGVIAELPEPGCLTFCLGEHAPKHLRRRLGASLRGLRQALSGPALGAFAPPPLPALAEPELPLGEAWRRPLIELPLEQALGGVAAEAICPYPPGIPLLIPGERIDGARLAWLLEQRGLWPGQIADTVKVVA
jgi:lysine decarboxylase